MNDCFDIKKYIVKYDDKKDMLSSLKKMKKQTLKDEFGDGYILETLEDLADSRIGEFEDLLIQTSFDKATQAFFKQFVENEESEVVQLYESDVTSNIAFLYEENGCLKYYIPTEIRQAIEDILGY